MSGRKRHIVVDTLGLLLAVVVHPADVQDRDGARLVLARLLGRFPRLQLIWADGAYGGKLVKWAKTMGGWTLELVRRPAQQRTFQVLPRRWVVERLAKPATALEQGLRVIVRNYRSLDPHLNDWPHVKETGPPSVFLDTKGEGMREGEGADVVLYRGLVDVDLDGAAPAPQRASMSPSMSRMDMKPSSSGTKMASSASM